MIAEVNCSDSHGEVRVIPSKSFAHRALIAAALSDDECEIICKANSMDIAATAQCLNALGAAITETDKGYKVLPIQKTDKAKLDCGESGSTLRFLVPVAAALGTETEFTGHGRLPSRPIKPLVDVLCRNGADIDCDGTLPMTVRKGLESGKFEISGEISSQFISGLIFALPLLCGDSSIEICGKTESKRYIDMTLDVVRQFGICAEYVENRIEIRGNQRYSSPKCFEVEGDWSNAAFWACLGAFSEKGIKCTGLSKNSVQGDSRIAEILKEFGADVSLDDNSITVKRGTLSGIRLDASEIPDLVPVVSVVAAAASGETVIYNAKRLRMKESDRIESTVAMLKGLGAEAYPTEDGLRIVGKPRLSGGCVDSFNDHRIVMSAAIASAICDNAVRIIGAEAARKSYGDFFDRLKELLAEIEISEV